jgi:hypothetical protein
MSLLSRFQGKKPAAAIEIDIASLRALTAETAAAADTLREQLTDAIIAGDDAATNALESQIAAAEALAASLRRRLPILESALAQAAATEAAEVRRAAIEHAEAVAAAADAELVKYLPLGQQLAALLARVTAASAYIDQVNLRHGGNVARPGAEHYWAPSTQHDEIRSRWVWSDGRAASEPLQDRDGTAPPEPAPRQIAASFDSPPALEKATLRTESVSVIDSASEWRDATQDEVRLPGLGLHAPDIWGEAARRSAIAEHPRLVAELLKARGRKTA